MEKGRVEAFTDGVIAIIITIMVLELKTPHAPTWDALHALWPVLSAYVLSFIYVGIYWNNHHHLFKAIEVVDGRVLWANLHLLFWLSLLPFATAWMSGNHFAALPTALYGAVLLMAAAAFTLLSRLLIQANGADGTLARAMGDDIKGKVSLALYVAAIPLALFVNAWLAGALYAVVALIWFVPDPRIERAQTT